MRNRIVAAASIALMIALSACGRNNVYADVARFHTNQPINRGTLFIQPADPVLANNLEFRTHAESVAIEMRRLGFQTVPDAAQAQYVATLDITQTDGTTVTRPGMTMGVPVGPTIIATPVGRGPRTSTERTTTIGVQIKRQADGAQIWEGRASKTGSAGSEQTTLTWAVPALSGALFKDFPGAPGVTQQVRL
ncbi:MAG: DUF4136 domain-containing protein [Sandaracinobacter sp.]